MPDCFRFTHWFVLLKKNKILESFASYGHALTEQIPRGKENSRKCTGACLNMHTHTHTLTHTDVILKVPAYTPACCVADLRLWLEGSAVPTQQTLPRWQPLASQRCAGTHSCHWRISYDSKEEKILRSRFITDAFTLLWDKRLLLLTMQQSIYLKGRFDWEE